MIVKALTLTGFKNFPHRTTINFLTPFTAFIGPNGSGKSNIMDAFLWVIGEGRNTLLRASRATDLIFSGNNFHSPSNFAEVILRIDNQSKKLPLEFTEIEIIRRIYRDGESEIFINSTPSHLKDVQELFWGSGLGRNSMALITQGEVERIVLSTPQELKELIEESTDLEKYKLRCQKALHKLKQTENSLERLQDIIGEVILQKENLEKERQRYLEYENLARELSKFEFKLKVKKFVELKNKFAEFQKKLSSLEKTLEEKSKKLIVTRQNFEKTFKNIEILKEKIVSQELETTQLEHKLKETERQVTFYNEQKDKITIEKKFTEEKIIKIKKELKRIEKSIATLTEELLLFKEDTINTRALIELWEKEGDNFQKTLSALEEKINCVTKEIETINSKLREKELHKNYILKQLQDYTATFNQICKEVDKLSEEKDRLNKQIAVLLDEEALIKETSQHLLLKEKELKNKLQQYTAIEKEIKESLQYLASQRRMLLELEKAFTGYYAGVRTIMIAKNQKQQSLSGIIAPFLGLIDIKQGFARAIEVALGGRAQNIVCLTEEDAKQAIAFLKDTAGGRATFLPLSLLKETQSSGFQKKTITGNGVLGNALDFISISSQYRPAAEYLLQNYWIVKTLDDATQLVKRGEIPQGCNLVTLEGELITRGGAITGGVDKKDFNLIKRRYDIKETEEKIKIKEAEELNIKNEIDKVKTLLEDTTQRLISLGKQESELKGQIHICRKELEFIKGNMNKKLQKQKDIELEQRDREKVVDSLLNEFNILENEKANLMLHYKQLQEEKDAALKVFKDWQTTYNIDYKQYISLLEKIKESNELLLAKQERISFWQSHENKLKEELKELEETILKNKKELDELIEKINLSTTSLQLLQKQFSELLNSKSLLKDKLTFEEKKLKDLENQINKLNTSKLDLEEKRLQLEKNKIQSYAELSLFTQGLPAQIYHTPPPQESEEELIAKCEELKSQMQTIGQVNPLADKECQHTDKRLKRLLTQQQDLENSIKSLQQFIENIKYTYNEKFYTLFKLINNEFQETFKMLFPRGEAVLKLTEENAGITIEVRLAGKGVKNISLLSGGEKALTALALIMAILRVNPPPFCFFDEVEAALDDGSVERFMKLLRTFTNTQFVLITHNKHTMEMADSLYGVTFKKGSGEIFSLKLSKEQELPLLTRT